MIDLIEVTEQYMRRNTPCVATLFYLYDPKTSQRSPAASRLDEFKNVDQTNLYFDKEFEAKLARPNFTHTKLCSVTPIFEQIQQALPERFI